MPTAVGGGSSLAAPLWALAISAYSLSASSSGSSLPALDASYASTSSGGGRTALLSGQFDYADSDSVPPASFWAAQPDTLVIPVLAAAIVPIFNLPGISSLYLTQTALARIFMGNITAWDDEAITVSNPDVTLPSERITVVVRSDSSGTTHIYTAALASFYEPFNASVGSAEVVQWPVEASYLLQESGNLGVVNGVESALYSIGYSVLNDAVSRQVPFAAVQNAAGVFVTASTTSVQYALYERAVLLQGEDPTDLLPNPSGNTPSLVNPSAPRAYPISGFSYLFLLGNTTRTNQTCAARRALVDLVLFFLYSDSLASLAALASFNTVPDLLRTAWQLETVITERVRCSDGALAGGAVEGQSAAVLSLLGAVVAGSVLNLATTSYSSDATTSISVVFSPNCTQSAVAALLIGGQGSSEMQASLALSSQIGDVQLSAMQQAAITALPLAFVPVVPVFNLGSNLTQLALSTALLGDMYAGVITQWSDASIAQLNPAVASQLPNMPIVLTQVNPSDALNPTTDYEATSILVQTLFRESASFSACFAPARSSNGSSASWWSWSFAAQVLPSCTSFSGTRWMYAVSETALAGVVLDRPYSLGFSMLASVGQTSVAQLRMSSGVLLLQSNNFTSLTACLPIDSTTTASALSGVSATVVSSACWPLTATLSLLTPSSFSLLTTADQEAGTCSQAQQLQSFIDFLDQPAITATASSAGLLWLASTNAPLIVANRATVIASTWTCNGALIVPPTTADGSRLIVQQNPSLVTLATLLCLVGAWVALLLAEMTEASASFTAGAAPSSTPSRLLVGSNRLRRCAYLLRDWLVALSRSQLSPDGWLLLTAVALSVTSCWTTLVVNLAAVSFGCSSCTADLTLHVDLSLVLIGLVVAFFPTWAGLWLIHSTARRKSKLRRGQQIAPSMGLRRSSSQRSSDGILLPPAELQPSATHRQLRSSTGEPNRVWFIALLQFVNARFLLGSALVVASVALVRLLLLRAVQTHADVRPHIVAEVCSAVLLWWPLATLSLLLCFHSARFRITAAFVWTVGLVCYQQTAWSALTVLYDESAVPFSGSVSSLSVSSTALVLMASLIGAVSVLLFVWLQFSKLQLSSASLRRQCASLLNKLGEAKQQQLADADRYQRQLTLSAALDNALELINMLRPLQPLSAGLLSKRTLAANTSAGDGSDSDTSHSLLQALNDRHSQRMRQQAGSGGKQPSTALQRAAEAWDDEIRGQQLVMPERRTPRPERPASNSFSDAIPDRSSPVPTLHQRLTSDGQSSSLLRAVLNHPAATELLKDVAHGLHSCENVQFLLFMQRYHTSLDDVDRQRWAALIVREFVATDAPQQINLSGSLAAQISRASTAPLLHRGLMEAEKEVTQLVNNNVWRQFRGSPQYAMCLQLLQWNAQTLRTNELQVQSQVSRASTTNTSGIEEVHEPSK